MAETENTTLAEEEIKTTDTSSKKPLYFQPRFTSERWSDGIMNFEQSTVSTTLYIKEDELLSFSEKEERGTRALLFKYQMKYAQEEYDLMRREFDAITAKLNQERAPVTEPAEHAFKEPTAPVDKKPRKKIEKSKLSTKSSSGSEQGDTSQEKILTPRKSKRIESKSSK